MTSQNPIICAIFNNIIFYKSNWFDGHSVKSDVVSFIQLKSLTFCYQAIAVFLSNLVFKTLVIFGWFPVKFRGFWYFQNYFRGLWRLYNFVRVRTLVEVSVTIFGWFSVVFWGFYLLQKKFWRSLTIFKKFVNFRT